MEYRVAFALENPTGSFAWEMPTMLAFLRGYNLALVHLDFVSMVNLGVNLLLFPATIGQCILFPRYVNLTGDCVLVPGADISRCEL